MKQNENKRWVGEFEFSGEVCIFPGATYCFLQFKIFTALSQKKNDYA